MTTQRKYKGGDVRDDGRIFMNYRKNGKERWLTPEQYKKLKEHKVTYQRRKCRRMRAHLQAIKLERGCADCGYNAHPAALDFDHRPGVKKLFNLANMSNATWTQVEAEVAKCDVVCANCHRIRTVTRAVQTETVPPLHDTDAAA